MTITEVTPYLMFPGTGAKAIAFYEKALGATPESIQKFGDMGGDPALADRIMHARLKVGPNAIMISDSHPSMGELTYGHQTDVCLQVANVADGEKIFKALAEGGKITMEYKEMFWGANHGQLTDQFGINWMVNAEIKK